MGFIAELRRRKVFRVAAAYAIVAWLLIEVSDTIFPRLALPDWTVTFVIVALVLGFPVALLLSWAYELSPEGVRRSTKAPRETSDATPGIQVDDLNVDVGRARVSRAGTEIPLPRLSFDFLLALIDAAPNIVSYDDLVERVWAGAVVGPETVSQRVKLLRNALGDDSRSPRYIAAVRGRGYRLIPAVVLPDAEAAHETWPQTGFGRVGRYGPAAAIGIVAMFAVGIAAVWLETRDTTMPIEPGSTVASDELPAVAVLPFDHLSGTPENELIARGIAESVLHQLANLPEISAIARTSSFAAAGPGDDAQSIGRKLNARYLVAGSVQSDLERLRVTAHLIDAPTGRHLWSMRFDRIPAGIFAVQDEIAVAVAQALELSLDVSSMERLVGQGTTNRVAYLAFMQGRTLLNSLRVASLPEAIGHLERAIRNDPGFAAAYVTLAEAKVRLAEFEAGHDRTDRFLAAWEIADDLVAEALELDPQSAEAYVLRGYLHAFTNLALAEADFRRGIELQPSNARGYEGLAAVLYQDPHRIREARVALERARTLDPLEPRHDVTMSVLLLYGLGNILAAEQSLLSALRKDPLYFPALTKLGELRWSEGALAEAISLGEQALSIDPQSEWTRRWLLMTYLDIGKLDAAQGIADDADVPMSIHRVLLHLFRNEWVLAGEAAYDALAQGTVMPIDGPETAAAIRMHARHTGDHARALATFEDWAGATRDELNRPVSGEPLGLRPVSVGLADMLQLSGDEEGARYLLETMLEDMDYEIRELGRSDFWHYPARSIVLAMLGRRDAALEDLEKYIGRDLFTKWWLFLDLEPAFEELRDEARFQQVLEAARQKASVQRLLAAEGRAN